MSAKGLAHDVLPEYFPKMSINTLSLCCLYPETSLIYKTYRLLNAALRVVTLFPFP